MHSQALPTNDPGNFFWELFPVIHVAPWDCVQRSLFLSGSRHKERIKRLRRYESKSEESCFGSLSFEKLGKAMPPLFLLNLWSFLYLFRLHAVTGIQRLTSAFGER